MAQLYARSYIKYYVGTVHVALALGIFDTFQVMLKCIKINEHFIWYIHFIYMYNTL